MSDVVFIKGLKINTVIGVYAWERAIKQTIIIDAQMQCDMQQAIKTDDVAYVIDYKAVCEDMERLCHEIQAQLLESLADKLAHYVLQNYPCQSITLTLHKPNAVKQADSVGVTITRTKGV